ncbi:cupin domain-containing protein (plasmid) [Sinorhizobium sp. B11]
MDSVSRRKALALGGLGGAAIVTITARAASVGNPDRPSECAVNANPTGLDDSGPENPALGDQLPAFQGPPSTDVGDTQLFWSSFNNAPKRVQNGGWARQVTKADFAISDAVSGVNMRLGPGGVREMHWHRAAEWAMMTNGRCRITVLDAKGRAYVQDVGPGDLWYFPAGFPHSLQGLGPDGCEFVIVFDEGDQSEYGTLLLTDWMAHTSPELLAKNFGIPQEAFKSIPLKDLWIFQGKEPGSLPLDKEAVASAGLPEHAFTYRLEASTPFRQNSSGTLHIADSSSFTVSKTIAAAIETIKPGAVREMHWHPNSDEWQYWLQGRGRMTVFDAGPRSQTADFHAGDIGYVKKSQGHIIENTGTTDLKFVAVFKVAEYQEVGLSSWLSHTPPSLVAQHLNMDPKDIERISRNRPGIMPR